MGAGKFRTVLKDASANFWPRWWATDGELRKATMGCFLLLGWSCVVFWHRPPLWAGIVFGLLGLVVAYITLIPSVVARVVFARRTADHEVVDELMAYSVSMLLWVLLPFVSLWSAAFERNFHAARRSGSLTYVGNCFWHLADLMPIIDIPKMLHQPDPPIRTWGLATGIGLVLVGVIGAFVLFEWGRSIVRSIKGAEDEPVESPASLAPHGPPGLGTAELLDEGLGAARRGSAVSASGTQEREASIAGKFEVYTDKAGKFRFRLKAGNGDIVATGEAYETKASAAAGCESVKNAAEDATVVDLT